jgi:hypothetical protein
MISPSPYVHDAISFSRRKKKYQAEKMAKLAGTLFQQMYDQMHIDTVCCFCTLSCRVGSKSWRDWFLLVGLAVHADCIASIQQ